MAILQLLVGLVLLAGGGELLIRGAVLLARLAGLTAAVIGLTVVAAGTSLPELTVSVLAALRGEPDLAVGNVVGSNIFNVTAALGLTALVSPLVVRGAAIRLEWPVMFVASAVCVVLMRDSLLDRLEAGFLLVSLVAFIAYTVRIARREVTAEERGEFVEEVRERVPPGRRRDTGRAVVTLSLGIVVLVIGGRFLVEGAVGLARLAGMSERVIGLTVVAAGTGMPELATSLVAAARRQSDVAVANMIGSNVFNLLGILGVTALVTPIRFSPALGGGDMWWMLGTALLLFPVLWRGRRIDRWEGAVLVSAYALYLATLLR
jgi:cation:H+ antiporter